MKAKESQLIDIAQDYKLNQMANWKVLTIISVFIGLAGLTLIITLFTATGGYVPFDVSSSKTNSKPLIA